MKIIRVYVVFYFISFFRVDNLLIFSKNISGYFCQEQRLVCISEQVIKLTAKEFDILALLITHPKRVFTYELIMELVWNEDYSLYSRKAVNNHVSNLRRKLKTTSGSPDYIKSVVSVGYKFEVT